MCKGLELMSEHGMWVSAGELAEHLNLFLRAQKP